MNLSGITLMVEDQTKAMDFFVETLGFQVRADVTFDNGFRWLTVVPDEAAQTAIILSLANQQDQALVGKQAGSGVLVVLQTSDFDSKHADMLAKGVVFDESPRIEVYGKVAIFRDLYGNRWDLL